MSEHEMKPRESEGQELTLSFNKKDFGEFIAGLLGQRRTIEKRFGDIGFLIDMNWLINLDQIIAQRIAAQNAGRLVSFSAIIYFDDGRAVTLTERAAFESFRDLSSNVSVGVDIKWAYLISFPLKKIPEKQEIRFLAFTDRIAETHKPDVHRPRLFLLVGDDDKQEMYYSVSFTDVTWGEDIANHISSFLTSHTKKLNKFYVFTSKLRAITIAPLFTGIGMFVSLYSVERTKMLQNARLISQYNLNDPSALNSFPEVQDKLKFLVDAEIAAIVSQLSITPALFNLFLYTIIPLGIYFFLITRKSSFICLNQFSKSYYERYSYNYEIIKVAIAISLVVGIVAALFAHRIYDFLAQLGWFG